MPAFRLGSFLFAAVSGIALAGLIAPAASYAYTPEQQEACTPDAMRLCGEFVPNVDAITACMVQKRAQLSPPCAVYFSHGPQPTEASSLRAGKPLSIKPARTTSTKATSTKTSSTKKATASKKKKKPDET